MPNSPKRAYLIDSDDETEKRLKKNGLKVHRGESGLAGPSQWPTGWSAYDLAVFDPRAYVGETTNLSRSIRSLPGAEPMLEWIQNDGGWPRSWSHHGTPSSLSCASSDWT